MGATSLSRAERSSTSKPTARELEARGVRALAVDAAVTYAVEALGGLDILVNGAAGNFLCLVEDLSPNGFGSVVEIDLKGTFHVSKAALPHLKVRGGSVLNISATLHYVGTAAQLHVSAAKAGIDALTRVLAVEWAPTASGSTESRPARSPILRGSNGCSSDRCASVPRS